MGTFPKGDRSGAGRGNDTAVAPSVSSAAAVSLLAGGTDDTACPCSPPAGSPRRRREPHAHASPAADVAERRESPVAHALGGNPIPPFRIDVHRIAPHAPPIRSVHPSATIERAGADAPIPVADSLSQVKSSSSRIRCCRRLAARERHPLPATRSRQARSGRGYRHPLCVIPIGRCEPEWCGAMRTGAPVAGVRWGGIGTNSLQGWCFPFPTFLAHGVRLSNPASQRTVPLSDGPLPGRGRPCAEVCAGQRSRPRTAAAAPSITPRWEIAR